MSQRTNQQNKSLHLFCDLMASGLNDAGYSVQKVCTLPISWTGDNFKQLIWKPVQKDMYPHKTSTTQLNRTEVSNVYEEINKLMAEKFGVSRPFPSEETRNE